MSPGTVYCVVSKLSFVIHSLTSWFSDKLANLRSPCLRVFLGKQYNCIRVNDNLLLCLRKPAMTRYPGAIPQFPPSLIFMRDQFCSYPWYCVRGSHVALFPWHFTTKRLYMYFWFPPFVLHILPFCSTWSWWRNNIVRGVQITKPVLFCPTFWNFHFLRSKL